MSLTAKLDNELHDYSAFVWPNHNVIEYITDNQHDISMELTLSDLTLHT